VGLAAPAYVVKLLEDDIRLRTLEAAVHETPIPESIESEAIAVDRPDAIDVSETPFEGTYMILFARHLKVRHCKRLLTGHRSPSFESPCQSN